MVALQKIKPRWFDYRPLAVVAATGPSLTMEVAEACRGRHIIAVNDAYRLLPFAEILYACDERWWDLHAGCPGFGGEKWSSHGSERHDNKLAAAARYGLRLVRGYDVEGFSLDPARIHYGNTSGFQAINLAILFGAKRILLVGFDMRLVEGKRHFFGDHPEPLNNSSVYSQWFAHFERAARTLPPDIDILNATPGTALTCFPMMDLHAALSRSA